MTPVETIKAAILAELQRQSTADGEPIVQLGDASQPGDILLDGWFGLDALAQAVAKAVESRNGN